MQSFGEGHHRKGDLKTLETFLSGLKRGDRIHLVAAFYKKRGKIGIKELQQQR